MPAATLCPLFEGRLCLLSFGTSTSEAGLCLPPLCASAPGPGYACHCCVPPPLFPSMPAAALCSLPGAKQCLLPLHAASPEPGLCLPPLGTAPLGAGLFLPPLCDASAGPGYA